LAGLYLWGLGTVGEVKDKLHIDPDHQLPDDHMVAKLGLSSNMLGRSDSLKSELKKLGVSMHLMMFTYIDPDMLSKAEAELKQWFREREAFVDVGKKFNGSTEVVAISNKRAEKTILKAEYKELSLRYGGAANGMI
jgi:uncharacterized protein with GYD domain